MNTHKPRTKEEAHEEALARDLTEQYTVGEQVDLIVHKSPEDNNGREAVARLNDVAVFIRPGACKLHVGTHVRAKISEVGSSHLKAVAIVVLG